VARPAWPNLEPHLRLEAAVRDRRLQVNRLVSSRDGSIAGVLAARPLEDVPRLASQLFPLCGMAHAAAALSAIEAALGVVPSPAQEALRELVVLAEHGATVGWRILMDWSAILDGAPDVRACADIRRAVAALNTIAERGGWLRLGGGHLRIDRNNLEQNLRALSRMLDALFPEALDLSFGELEETLQNGSSVPARLLRKVRAELPADYGRHVLPLLPARSADWFAVRLAADSTFSDAPTLDGIAAEVGPLAAQRHALVKEALAHWGPSLATRLLAAALDAFVVSQRLSHISERLTDDDPAAADVARAGQGAGVVETARGPLAYYVEVEGGRVRLLRSVAPTEWNFHPNGPFVAALKTAPEVAEPVAAARLLAASFDPCVPFDIALAATRRAPAEVTFDA
jgi:hypothetical protein